jgi:hypothetical protein
MDGARPPRRRMASLHVAVCKVMAVDLCSCSDAVHSHRTHVLSRLYRIDQGDRQGSMPKATVAVFDHSTVEAALMTSAHRTT